MVTETLSIERNQGVAIATLNRPDAMNALSRELRDALATAFEEFEADRETRVVVLTGAGRAFSAGLDLRELSQPGRGGAGGRNPVRAMEIGLVSRGSGLRSASCESAS